MEITSRDKDSFDISLSEVELGTIGNCLNEVCNGIDVFEFETRIGVTREEVQKLLAKFVGAYRKEE